MIESILYLVLAIAGFFVFVQIYFAVQAWFKKGKPVAEFSGPLGDKIRAGNRLMLYFYSPGCAACRTMTPVVDQLREENEAVHKIDLSRDMQLARTFGVMGTPAVVMVSGQRIEKYILGARNESFLRRLLEV